MATSRLVAEYERFNAEVMPKSAKEHVDMMLKNGAGWDTIMNFFRDYDKSFAEEIDKKYSGIGREAALPELFGFAPVASEGPAAQRSQPMAMQNPRHLY